MRCTRRLRLPGLFFALLLSAGVLLPQLAFSQDATVKHARKYKAPPETSKIVVIVTKKSNGKPISNAAVVFNPTKDGKDIGSLEVKTDPEGKATVDIIPTGSMVRVQIIANGFATFAEDYLLSEPTKEIAVSMLRPQEQISTYVDNQGKASERKPGVQEPVKPSKPATSTNSGTNASTPATTPAPPQK